MRFLTIVASLVVLAMACSAYGDECTYGEYPVYSRPDGQYPLGGYSPIKEFDVEPVIELTNDIWNQATSASNTNYYHLSCLKSAARQIVSGTNYKVKAVFTETSCDKSKYNYKTFDKDECLTQVEYETEDPITHECKLSGLPFKLFLSVSAYLSFVLKNSFQANWSFT